MHNFPFIRIVVVFPKNIYILCYFIRSLNQISLNWDIIHSTRITFELWTCFSLLWMLNVLSFSQWIVYLFVFFSYEYWNFGQKMTHSHTLFNSTHSMSHVWLSLCLCVCVSVYCMWLSIEFESPFNAVKKKLKFESKIKLGQFTLICK